MKKIIILILTGMLFLASSVRAETSCGFFERIFSNSCEQKKELEKLKKRMQIIEANQVYQNCVNRVMFIFDEDRLFAETYCKNR